MNEFGISRRLWLRVGQHTVGLMSKSQDSHNGDFKWEFGVISAEPWNVGSIQIWEAEPIESGVKVTM